MGFRYSRIASLAAPAVVLWATGASALGADEARTRAGAAIAAVEGDTARAGSATPRVRPTTVAERVTAGDLLVRTGDFERAIDILNQVVELYRQGKATEPQHADGLFLLGEAYFSSGQLLSARREFREIIDRGSRSAYQSYLGRSLSRLVDVALRTEDLASLDFVFARLSTLPASDASGSLQYARAKAYFARGDLPTAQSLASGLPAGAEYALQANYLLGVILTKQVAGMTPPPAPAGGAPVPAAPAVAGASSAAAVPPSEGQAFRDRFSPAIEQFRRVTRMPAKTNAQRHVVDLAWIAIGRLFYEADYYLDASEAYSHVDRSSPEFMTMLYELAWVYVRLGDYHRAQRALEVLMITDPKKLRLADGSLLRADLMLRSGDLEKAREAYEGVRGEFEPIRQQVDQFLQTVTDPAAYYDRLTSEEYAATSDDLSPAVLEWAREEAEDERVFAVINDVTRSRDLVKRSRQLVAKLNAVLATNARVKAFPGLKAGLEQTVGLINKVGLARMTLAQGLDDVGGDAPAGELAQVRKERRELMKRMKWLPVSDGDFSNREASGDRQWNSVSQELQAMTLEADRLQAIVNGLKRVLSDADQQVATVNQASRDRFNQEIAANERDLEGYRTRIAQYREAIELGRVQIGFGDNRYTEDDQVRQRFKDVFAREVALAVAGQDSRDAAQYAGSIGSLLGRADAAEAKLGVVRQRLEAEALKKGRELEKAVNVEAVEIEKDSSDLETLDQQARLLVGEFAMKSFAMVRDRLKGIVLRADVGIVQEAWEVREQQTVRVRNLQRERSREERDLNDELQEVLDDVEDPE